MRRPPSQDGSLPGFQVKMGPYKPPLGLDATELLWRFSFWDAMRECEPHILRQRSHSVQLLPSATMFCVLAAHRQGWGRNSPFIPIHPAVFSLLIFPLKDQEQVKPEQQMQIIDLTWHSPSPVAWELRRSEKSQGSLIEALQSMLHRQSMI